MFEIQRVSKQSTFSDFLPVPTTHPYRFLFLSSFLFIDILLFQLINDDVRRTVDRDRGIVGSIRRFAHESKDNRRNQRQRIVVVIVVV